MARRGLEALYADVRRPIAGAVSAIIGRDDAEDILHDAFVAYLAQPAWIRRPGAWLGRVARNRALNSVRRRPIALQPEEIADPTERTDRASVHQLVRGCLETLPERSRAALHLRYVQGADYSTIADALGVRVAQAHVVVHRAVRSLGRTIVRRVADAYEADACVPKLERMMGLAPGEHAERSCARCRDAWSELSELRRFGGLVPLLAGFARRLTPHASRPPGTAAQQAVGLGLVLAVTVALPLAPNGPGHEQTPRDAAGAPAVVVSAPEGRQGDRTMPLSAFRARPKRAPAVRIERVTNAGPASIGSGDGRQASVGRGTPLWAGARICDPLADCPRSSP